MILWVVSNLSDSILFYSNSRVPCLRAVWMKPGGLSSHLMCPHAYRHSTKLPVCVSHLMASALPGHSEPRALPRQTRCKLSKQHFQELWILLARYLSTGKQFLLNRAISSKKKTSFCKEDFRQFVARLIPPSAIYHHKPWKLHGQPMPRTRWGAQRHKG